MSGFPKRDENLMPFDEDEEQTNTNPVREVHVQNPGEEEEKTPEPLKLTLSAAFPPLTPEPPRHTEPPQTPAPTEAAPIPPPPVHHAAPMHSDPEPLKPFAENFPPPTERTFISDEPTQVPTGDLAIPPTVPGAEPKWKAMLAQAKEHVRFAYDRFQLLTPKQQRWIYAGSAGVAALFTVMLALPRHRPGHHNGSAFHMPKRQHIAPPVAPPPPAPVVEQRVAPPAPPPVVEQHVVPPAPAPVVAKKPAMEKPKAPVAAKAPAKAKAAAPTVAKKAAPPAKTVAKGKAPAGKKMQKAAAKDTKKGKAVASAKGKAKAPAKKDSKKVAKGKKDTKKLAKKKDKAKRSIATDNQ